MTAPKVQPPHVLVVTASDDPDWPKYSIECPGVTNDCRSWEPCGAACPRPMTDEQNDRLYEDGESHGVEHQRIQGEWMVPTERCFVAHFEDLWEPARDLGLPPGRWPVTFTVEDEGECLRLERAL